MHGCGQINLKTQDQRYGIFHSYKELEGVSGAAGIA
jgi:hypothetical protein